MSYKIYKVHVYADGSKYWYLNDKRHREDGPAIERSDGYKEWYLNGEELTENEWKKRTSLNNKMNIEEISNIHNSKKIQGMLLWRGWMIISMITICLHLLINIEFYLFGDIVLSGWHLWFWSIIALLCGIKYQGYFHDKFK